MMTRAAGGRAAGAASSPPRAATTGWASPGRERSSESPVTICVPLGNNPEKNEAMRGLGAKLVEEGRDYDESLEVAHRLVRERGLTMVHSTNDPA